MSKQKKQGRTRPPPKKLPPRGPSKLGETSLLRSLWRFLVAASVIITIAAGISSFKPRLSIRYPSTITDGSSGQVFTVSNDGWLSLRNVAIQSSVVQTYREFRIAGYPPETDVLAFRVEPIRAEALASGQTLSIRLPSETNPRIV